MRSEGGHGATVDELYQLGFVDAYHHLSKEEQGSETKNTFYLYRHLDRGYHIDHCFVRPKWLKTYEIFDDHYWLKYSDHVPCMLEIEIKGDDLE